MSRQEFITIELDQPIKRGKGEDSKAIKEIVLRRPMGGDLRGLTLIDVSMSKVDAITTLLPRISNPVVHANDIKEMDSADLMDIGLTIAGFFTKAKFQDQLESGDYPTT